MYFMLPILPVYDFDSSFNSLKYEEFKGSSLIEMFLGILTFLLVCADFIKPKKETSPCGSF